MRSKRPLVAAAAAGTLGAACMLATLGPGTSTASSHREAPLIAGDPQADNTDVYAFTSPDAPDTVTLTANWIPFEEPNGGPNFYPFATKAHYNIKVDNDGDGYADITYRWTFRNEDRRGNNTFLYNNGPVTSLRDATLLFRQHYSLTEVTKAGTRTLIKDAIAAPSFVGKASMPNYAALRQQAIKTVPGGGKTYVGQADDSFFLDLRIFDLLYGGNLSETGTDTLKGYNVNTIALQVPKTALAFKGNPRRNPAIGVWSTTDRQGPDAELDKAPAGQYHQVSRLGNPLVNEVVSPAGLKDAFNRLDPSQDHTVAPLVNRVLNPEVPQLIQKIYKIPAPATPRKDLQEIFLTGIAKKAGGPIKADLNSQLLNKDANAAKFTPAEELRLNMGVPVTARPNRLGVLAGDLQGFPNGRRLTDDVVDIELQALEGAAQTGKLVPALAKGDRVNTNDVAFGQAFPYVALPHNSGSGKATPSGGAATGGGATAGLQHTGLLGLGAGLLAAAAGALMFHHRRRILPARQNAAE
ncbi:DUF4331 domain-containing protein [Actinomadura opuntiae]|uniref:DUF4331 domain-containing protein n=1 Tax=Actinomadura sp. OS1-43 TaxID=604315 RepID=UPI00255B048F|nr:DUF4331 domain-containing protein [Actinomadura sp. OS1-43]MDL4816884.1 DUF4331 domain-containing protein [Actinomadura sp. OS1-43]